MFCPNCGNKVDDSAMFCGNCGCNLAEANGDPSYDSEPVAPTPEPEPSYSSGYSSGYESGQTNPTPEPEPSYSAPQVPSSSLSNIPVTPVVSTPGAVALRTDRDLVMFIVLSIVTCGIYSYWYVYQMAQDTNAICADDGKNTPGLAAYILLSILTCGIYSLYWQYQLAKRLDENAPRYGVELKEHASDVLVWIILGIFICNYISFVATHAIIINLNKLSAAYNQVNGLTYQRV